jgi:hypothetical protein
MIPAAQRYAVDHGSRLFPFRGAMATQGVGAYADVAEPMAGPDGLHRAKHRLKTGQLLLGGSSGSSSARLCKVPIVSVTPGPCSSIARRVTRR